MKISFALFIAIVWWWLDKSPAAEVSIGEELVVKPSDPGSLSGDNLSRWNADYLTGAGVPR